MINIIYKENGKLQFESGITITNKLTKEEFLQSIPPDKIIIRNDSHYSRFTLLPQKIEDDFFQTVVTFNPSNIIYSISICILDSKSEPKWENWSEKQEIQRKLKHDSWLARFLGNPPYNFSWGEISSNYDPRTASSSITILYK